MSSPAVASPAAAWYSAPLSKAKDVYAKHKKSCLLVVFLVIVAILLVFVWAHNCPPNQGLTATLTKWISPDYKLLNKNHTGQTRRSDSKEDTWNKDDFVKSVEEFNRQAGAGGEMPGAKK